MTTLTPDQAILIRNIVIAIAVFLVWGVGILVAYNQAGTFGSVLAFFLGPLGVLVAVAMRSDPKDVAGTSGASARPDIRVPPADPVADAMKIPDSGQLALGNIDQSPGAPALTAPSDQAELLRRILILQAEEIRLLQSINRVALYFFWVSIIGAVITLCIVPYLNSLF